MSNVQTAMLLMLCTLAVTVIYIENASHIYIYVYIKTQSLNALFCFARSSLSIKEKWKEQNPL